MKKKALAVVACMALLATGCGSSSGYDAYSEAYQKLAAAGSLDADIDMTLTTEETEITAEGNMKMDSDGAVYYELTVGKNIIKQYVEGTTMYSDVNGVRRIYDTSSTEEATEVIPENADEHEPESEQEEVDPDKSQSTFDTETFLLEFSSMLEAGKLKEMGLLDPIPEASVTKVTTTKDSDGGVTYDLSVPDVFVETLFNVMIAEQITDEDYSLSFSNLEDFSCVMHANSDGILDGMTYGGKTDVTVPAELTDSGEEETFTVEILIEIGFENPGEAVEVPTMDLSDWGL